MKLNNQKEKERGMAKKQGTKDTKSFQIVMKPEVHRLLKQRAQQLRISIGDLIEKLDSFHANTD